MAPGEKWDLILSDAAPMGKYVYVCTPHEVLGMAGILYLEG
jgi:plastocyanin